MYLIMLLMLLWDIIQVNLETGKKAAERGHPSAQYNLGGMYLRGDGVEKNLVMAYFWRKLAAGDEDEQSAGLAAIAKKMTSSELSKAKKAVKNWKPRR